MNPKDLNEAIMLFLGYTENNDGFDELDLKEFVLDNYRSVDDIKKAVGEMEEEGANPSDTPLAVYIRNQLRKEILTALGIEEGEHVV